MEEEDWIRAGRIYISRKTDPLHTLVGKGVMTKNYGWLNPFLSRTRICIPKSA